jgi:hypothetical protein
MTTNTHAAEALVVPPPLTASILVKGFALLAVLVGVATFGWALSAGQTTEAWTGYLVGSFYALTLGLFGTLWVSILYLSKGAWSVSMRRIPEAMAAWVLPGGLLCVLVLLGGHDLYHWTDAAAVAADPLLLHKAPFLNARLFVALTVGSVLTWTVLGMLINRNSRKQDASGDVELGRANTTLSAVFVVIYALTFSAVSFYLLMSVEAHWFSTMFAVLAFTDMMQLGLAFVSLVAAWLVARGRLPGLLNQNHLHSVVKMLFAFTGFWAYIYFCQFMLMWYSNIPEEVVYFTRRWENGWWPYMFVLPVVKFAVPFLVLLRRESKRNPRLVMVVSVWVMVAQAYELFLMVAPGLGHGDAAAHAHLPVVELGVTAGFVGMFVLVFCQALGRHNAVPLRDPRLQQCLELHQ